MFLSFITLAMITSIVDETVRYAHSQGYENFVLTVPDFMLYLAILIGFGIHKLPSVRYIWSRNRYLRIDGLSKLMTRDKFLEIHRFLHLPPDIETSENLFYKVTKFLWKLRANCEKNFIPYQDVSVDEATPRSQHRTRAKSRTKHKNVPFGIDIKCLVCSVTVYMFTFTFFKMKELVLNGCSRTTSLVYFLCSKLPGGGFRIWVDNFYNSPILARFLWRHFGDYVSGTWRANFGVPDLLKSARVPKEYCSYTLHKGDGDDFRLLGIKINDNKIFYFLTSWLVPILYDIGGIYNKLRLAIIHEYNKKKGGVDRFDQKNLYYSTYVKSRKWWRVLWSWGINVGLNNGYVCYSAFNSITRLEYHLKVIDEIVAKYWTGPQVETRHPGQRYDEYISERSRLTGRTHWPYKCKQRRCIVCYARDGTRKGVTSYCRKCNVGLCLGKCYESWHTKLKYAK
jgi:Transposase IS4